MFNRIRAWWKIRQIEKDLDIYFKSEMENAKKQDDKIFNKPKRKKK